jgi:phytoene dehydrogenase-like protein
MKADAIVIGAGPNGLVAACALADAGWDVLVLEAADDVGGAVRSAELAPGYVHDLFSSCYPLAAASPVLARLDLQAHGLRWRHSPTVLAHLAEPGDQPAAVLHRDPAGTAAALDADHPGDGDTWLRLVEHWNRVRDPLLAALFTPLPAAVPLARLLTRLSPSEALWTARLAAAPVHRLGAELFGGQGGRLLLAGNAAHTDIPTVGALSGAFGWLLAMLAQDVGFPVPEGGAGRLSGALASRARAAGARILTGARVERVVVRGGRTLGVLTAGGTAVRARHAVLACCAAPTLYAELLAPDDVPPGVRDALRRFEWDLPTVKANWSLREPVGWRAGAARRAGTIHLGAGLDELAEWSTSLGIGRPSPHTFALVGQPAVADRSRAPGGGEALWAYTHLPRSVGRSVDRSVGGPGGGPGEHADELVRRMEALLEAHAPGFRDLVVHRFVQGPGALEEADAALVGGAVKGGTAQPHQQLIFRPMPGTGRPETAVERLYLAGAGAHPGGGVHGAAGWQAARAAILGARLGGTPGRLLTGAQRLLHHPAPW